MGGWTPFALERILSRRAGPGTSPVGAHMALEGRRIEVRGTVQGVGFRPWVYRVAREEGISGRVRNHTRGVTIEAFGSAPALAAFLRRIESDPPPAADVRELRTEAIPAEAASGFEIVASREDGERHVSIPADLATCPECLRELRRPRRPAARLRLHELHALRPALHDRPRRALRPPGDDHGRLPDVPRLPARVRGRDRPALPRAADRLPGLRSEAAPRRARRPAARRRGPAHAGGPGAARQPDRRGQGAWRLPPGL